MNSRRCGWAVAAILGVLSLAPLRADQRDFAWSYQWFTPSVGEHELELHGLYKSDANQYQAQVEYETGITDRWGLGLYALLGGSDTEAFGFQGVKLENRYRFGRFKRNRLLHAAYLELSKEGAEAWELEGKWLMSVYTRNDDNYALNLILENKLSSHAHLEFAYTAGWSHGFGKWRLGIEHTGHTTDKEYYLGPTAVLTFGGPTRLVANVMGGLTSGSSAVASQVIFQHEF